MPPMIAIPIPIPEPIPKPRVLQLAGLQRCRSWRSGDLRVAGVWTTVESAAAIGANPIAAVVAAMASGAISRVFFIQN
jgi:hypothetical protein